MMNRGSILTPSDHEEFWIRIVLGPDPDWLKKCLRRAYLDMSRTLHGFAAVPSGKMLFSAATQTLERRFTGLQRQLPVGNEKAFDEWHYETCVDLINLYGKGDYPDFRVGQAQKWVNMTFKYASAVGNRLPDYGDIYDLCHLPIDNVVLKALQPRTPPRLSGPWSRVRDYHLYMDFQTWVRRTFTIPPLDVDFLAWMDRDVSPFVRE